MQKQQIILVIHKNSFKNSHKKFQYQIHFYFKYS